MDVHKNRGSADIEYKSKVNEFVSGGIHKLGMRIAPEMPGHKKPRRKWKTEQMDLSVETDFREDKEWQQLR